MTGRYSKANLRPVPETFAQLAKSVTPKALARYFHANDKTVARWIDEIGAEPFRKPGIKPSGVKRHMPADFPQMAAEMSSGALCLHYQATTQIIARWRRECGVPSKAIGGVPARPVPQDFAYHGPRMTITQLSVHYRVDDSVIRRWYAESGVERKRQDGVLARAKQQIRAPLPTGDGSFEGQCAHFLRKTEPNVFRCDLLIEGNRRWGDALKLPERGRWYWNVGGKILDRTQLVELAERKGFGAWRMAA